MKQPMNRRTALKVVGGAPILATLVWAEPEVAEAHRKVAAVMAAGDGFAPKFFTSAEWKTVRVLSDLIIPRDKRSGSATDVGVPEFIDFMMIDQPDNQPAMRAGLAWLDAESQRRFGTVFSDAAFAQHAAILNDLAWPARAPASLKDGVAFFISFRNLVLTGFWTSKAGIHDLQYTGNTFVPHWDGCPPAALKKLGVSYDD
ncbi:MAG TPA: gluconate 2-dehydrogenase subunit 3 family protein [Longimicrobiales bacterium]